METPTSPRTTLMNDALEPDYGQQMQRAAEEHLVACFDALAAEEEGEPIVVWPEDMGGPFCGCTTCVVRETLTAALPLMEPYVISMLRSGE